MSSASSTTAGFRVGRVGEGVERCVEVVFDVGVGIDDVQGCMLCGLYGVFFLGEDVAFLRLILVGGLLCGGGPVDVIVFRLIPFSVLIY
jgi:hypothetical protein